MISTTPPSGPHANVEHPRRIMEIEEKREFKDALYGHFARLGQALAHGRRLELLELLAQGERTVDELAEQTSMPVASASQHLRTLYRARLVARRSEGTYAYYRLSSDAVIDLVRALHTVGEEQLAEIERLLNAHRLIGDDVREVTAEELATLIEMGDVTVIDVRPRKEYEQGHVEGARSLPINELPERIHELAQERNVVAYCRGRYCVFAHEAVRLLTDQGIRACRLQTGFPDWKRAGYCISAAA